jgi:hypothetical protein
MTFKLWSELNPKAKEELKPDFGFRNWDSLSKDEKYKIWKYLEFYFFGKDPRRNYNNLYANFEGYYYKFFGDDEDYYYKFFRDDEEAKRKRIVNSVMILNDKFKARSYAKNFLENSSFNSACRDFYEIFIHQSESVVIELLSLYCKVLISEREEETIDKIQGEDEEKYQQRLENWRWEDFDKFAQNLNDVFTDFGINLYLTRQGFMPRQEEKIVKEIYEPVLSFLSHPKWKEVSKILSDSFDEYRKNTPQGYSNCVTNTVSSIQAFLQIIVNGETGKGEIAELIKNGQKRNLIPNDFFTQVIFKNIESILARQRKETGIAHPKKEYATEKNSRLVLNLAMIFFQHCIQK